MGSFVFKQLQTSYLKNYAIKFTNFKHVDSVFTLQQRFQYTKIILIVIIIIGEQVQKVFPYSQVQMKYIHFLT